MVIYQKKKKKKNLFLPQRIRANDDIYLKLREEGSIDNYIIK